MYRSLAIMTGFNFMGRVAVISLSLILYTALASEERTQNSQLYYLEHSWPPRDLKTSASFPIGYGIGGAGFLPKGGFLGVGGLGAMVVGMGPTVTVVLLEDMEVDLTVAMVGMEVLKEPCRQWLQQGAVGCRSPKPSSRIPSWSRP